MALKKSCRLIFIYLSLFFLAPLHTQIAFGQTLQITTHLKSIEGAPTWVQGPPTWLLIIRNIQTGKVLPYIFDIRKEDNYWVALTEGHTYRVTTSSLTFGPLAKIHNFCHLENGILQGKSMWITITGILSPDTHSFKCHVVKYTD